MIKMSMQELFEVGCSFESSIGEGTKSERARIPKNFSRISLSNDELKYISTIDKEVNFLISGEIWCPDFQINATIIKKFCNLNSNFNMSVITMARGKKFLAPLLEITDFKGPTIVLLDKEFNVLGLFEERPKSVKAFDNFDDVKLNYYKGKYIPDSINDFIKILQKL